MSASAVPAERPNAETPAAMTEVEIAEIIVAFASAAARGKAAGFDAIEIHGANTYLLQQFVSPHSNRREDAWGLDRLSFPMAVTDAVLSAVGPFYPVGYRFSPEEIETPGIRITDTEALIEALISMPLAYLHLSLRDYRQPSQVGDYEEPTLKRVLRKIDGRLPLMVAGLIVSTADAEEALSWGTELLSLARMAIMEPEWPMKAMTGEPMRTVVPARDAGKALTLPEGMEQRIYSVPGWFPVEAGSVASEKLKVKS